MKTIRKHIVPILAVSLVLVTIAGIWGIAASNYGTEADPLVTLSYINDILTKEITDAATADTQTKLDALAASLNGRLDELKTTNPVGARYVVLALDAGSTVTCDIGTEIIHRIGSVSCVAPSSPGFIDATDGTILESGSELVKNHLYTVTMEERSLKANERSTVVI
ncbi:MAG: hypothetical protein LBN97_03495, partial [Oscillospiraceae bacterium]|nr:hypothetical protein [Oscillospiraceae bacterium]